MVILKYLRVFLSKPSMPDDLAWRTCCIEYVLRRVCMCWCVCVRAEWVSGERERGGKRSVSWASGVTQEQKLCVCWWIFFFLSQSKVLLYLFARYCGVFWNKCEIVWNITNSCLQSRLQERIFLPISSWIIRIPFLCMYAEMPTDLIIIRYPL